MVRIVGIGGENWMGCGESEREGEGLKNDIV
jgi:hypothetical protein